MQDEHIPLDQIESARNLPLPEQAECLLNVIARMFVAMHAAHDGALDCAIEAADARQRFRECVESLGRPLDKHEVEELFVLTVIAIGGRLSIAD